MLLGATLADDGDLVKILLYAALAGLLGALVGELITTRGRSRDWGGFEWPRWKDSKHWFDLGSFAAIPIGIIAGCIAALTLAPETTTVTNGVAVKTIETEAVLATAVIAGLAGAAFLRVLQDRFVALAGKENLRGVVEAVTKTLEEPAPRPAPASDAVSRVMNATDHTEAAAVVADIAGGAAQATAAKIDAARQLLIAAVAE
jgi:hypothetical protein